MQSQSRPVQKRPLLPIRFVSTGAAITTAVFIILLIAGISYAETSQPWPPSKIVLKAGKHTLVTQIAYFNFTGASLWVNYPWYGGMKSTLTGVAEWEQNTALKYSQKCMVARRY